MNKSTYEKIVALVPMIEQFRSLEKGERSWLKPLLNPTVITALKIIELIQEREMTYAEIADDLQINKNTIKQIIAALEEGGMNIKVSGKAALAEVGRLRLLKRKV